MLQYLGRDNAAILNSLPHLLAFYMFIEYRIVLLKLSHCENESCSRECAHFMFRAEDSLNVNVRRAAVAIC